MTKIEVTGWRYGFNKVQFTLLLQATLGYRLRDAKGVTDAIMADKVVELVVPDDAAADLLAQMDSLGASASLALPVVA